MIFKFFGSRVVENCAFVDNVSGKSVMRIEARDGSLWLSDNRLMIGAMRCRDQPNS